MKVSYALKLLREYIIWPQIKILDFELIVTNKTLELTVGVSHKGLFPPADGQVIDRDSLFKCF